jgi:hypothetical protein
MLPKLRSTFGGEAYGYKWHFYRVFMFCSYLKKKNISILKIFEIFMAVNTAITVFYLEDGGNRFIESIGT